MSNKVKVLMSTYNGQKYLREQIDSILNQEGVDVSLLVRDDGSTDDTWSILTEYAESYKNIEIIKGDNIGFANSFMTLIYKANENDNIEYYALSDQDDVWYPDKLSSAVNKLEKTNSSKMRLYFSNTLAVDENLNPLFKTHRESTLRLDKAASLVRYFILGCTMVFDKEVANFVSTHKPVMQIMMHDLWIHQTCAFFGTIVYDDTPRIMYRQHSSNTAGVGFSIHVRMNRLKRSLGTYQRRHFRELNAQNFLVTYDNVLNEKDKLLVSLIADYRKSLWSRLQLLMNNSINMGTTLSNIAIRIRILLGIF